MAVRGRSAGRLIDDRLIARHNFVPDEVTLNDMCEYKTVGGGVESW